LQRAHLRRLLQKKAFLAGSKTCLLAMTQHLLQRLARMRKKTSVAKAAAMSVVNAASVQSAANEVDAMAAVVAVVDAVNAPKVALSALANAVLNEAKAGLIRVVNAALKVVQNALRLKAVVTVVAKGVAVQNVPANHVQMVAMKVALRVSPAVKAVVTAIAATDQNAQSAETVAVNARACHVTQRKKNWQWPIRPPWQPLRAVRSPHRKLNAKPVNHAKVAANAVVVALNAVTKHPRLTLAKRGLPKLVLSVQRQ
jgi:hypothetical protein